MIVNFTHLNSLIPPFQDESGCTAVCCIITPSHVVCGNVGDSRCVIGSKGSAISMTDDHKAENPEEKARVEAAGNCNE
jgi:serine/threonine protein phosphatase PrpC